MLNGVNALDDAVKVTLGPRGRNAVLDRSRGTAALLKPTPVASPAWTSWVGGAVRVAQVLAIAMLSRPTTRLVRNRWLRAASSGAGVAVVGAIAFVATSRLNADAQSGAVPKSTGM